VIFMPRPGATGLNYRQLETAVLTLWRKAAVLSEGGTVS
jgi:RNase P protein component